MMRILKNGLSLMLAMLMVFASLSVFAEGSEEAEVLSVTQEEAEGSQEQRDAQKKAESESRLAEIRDLLNSITYRTYRENHADAPAAAKTVHIDAEDYDPAATTATVLLLDDVADSNGNVEAGKSICIGEEGRVTWNFTVQESAL